VILGGTTLSSLGGGEMSAGFARLRAELPPEMLDPLPTETAAAFWGWAAVLAIATLGNIPGQDLLQRIFSARSATVARSACLLAGVMYVLFGAIPVLIGLSAGILLPESRDQAIVPALAHTFLSPVLAVVFTVALASAVLSTIDSAILSPASVIAQNILPRVVKNVPALALNRACVVFVTMASLAVAYVGEDAYALLEGAYEIGLVGLFVPLAFGVYLAPRSELPALLAMSLGIGLWLVHLVAGWDTFAPPLLGGVEVPVSLAIVTINVAVYLIAHGAARAGPRESS
jgi:Na+/proline symporter